MSEKTPFPLVETGSPLEQYERVMFTHIMLSMARTLKDDNLSLAQVAALHWLDMRGQLRISDLAEALAIQLPGASKVASDLVDRGLVERREDAADRRAKVLSMTAAGRALIETMSKRRAREAPLAMAGLDSEVSRSFNRMFEAMFAAGLTRAD